MIQTEDVQGTIWCRPIDAQKITSRIEAELKEVIWSDATPTILPSISHKGFEMLTVKLVHAGDILDDSLLAVLIIKVSRFFKDCFVRFDVTEGDLFLIESASQSNEEFDIDKGVSIAHDGVLFRINEEYAKANNAPEMISEENKYPDIVQKAFQQFCSRTQKEIIYHTMKLFVPKKLKRFLLFEPSNITAVYKNAEYKSSASISSIEFVEYPIKFRRYQIAILDGNQIKIPKSFIDICSGKSNRYIRISYLMLCSYQKLIANEKHGPQIEQANEDSFNYLDEAKVPETDDDVSWIDNSKRPEEDYEDIGTEMAERFSHFVKEISEFDTIDDYGPINFNFDAFSNKLDHFLDSSDDNEEDYEEDPLEAQLDNVEDRQIRNLSQGKGNSVEFATACWNESLFAQPNSSGPTSEYMSLFDLKQDQK